MLFFRGKSENGWPSVEYWQGLRQLGHHTARAWSRGGLLARAHAARQGQSRGCTVREYSERCVTMRNRDSIEYIIEP